MIENWNPQSEIDRLIEEADELDEQAERLKGNSWRGNSEPPWTRLQRNANDKRTLASLLKLNMLIDNFEEGKTK